MPEQEILYKNQKFNNRLIDLKSKEYKLSISDRIKKFIIRKYPVPNQEKETIDSILHKEGHVKFVNFQHWKDESGNDHPSQESSISEKGLLALKKNYYSLNIITNVLTTPQTLLNIILIITSIILGSYQIKDRNSDKNLEKEIKQVVTSIDSLKNEMSSLKISQTAVNVNKTQANDTNRATIDSLSISKKNK